MSQVTWKESYSVNNDIIDEQHQIWIKIYNKLDQILLKGPSSEVSTAVLDTFNAMQEYADYHFRQEEEYMQEINYPLSDLVAHRRLHIDFEDQLYNYKRKICNGELVLGSEVIDIIKKWLLNHILEEDQKYNEFVIKR